ncbi:MULTISPECIES: hypothetical protein [unclassified Cyanobium]|uniref:hypothetical protein n=1 Tax=unclassified Cyanobium TaxID=2627006 RepID=UPI0020CC3AC8|nr:MULTISPECIES: hypothetical protein [unclassified Cyanobium]MCP9776761.1 hypothetical protein [Cyanobium sp. Tous-M-B4]
MNSSVILDVITADPHWAAWSPTQLAHALLESPELITRDERHYRQAFSGLKLILP